MDAESAVIQQQMEETRQSLSEKLETLEDKVTENMQEATQVVTDSVDTMKETVKETVDAVQETVATVKESVQETVANVKGSVEETFTSIKDTFDLGVQVREHPWLMVGASVFVGYWVGSRPDFERSGRPYDRYAQRLPQDRWQNRARQSAVGAPSDAEPDREPKSSGPVAPATIQQPSHSWHWLDSVLEAFRPEIAKLQQMAVQTAADAVGEMLSNAAPPNMKSQLTDMVDRVAHRFVDSPADSPRRGQFN